MPLRRACAPVPLCALLLACPEGQGASDGGAPPAPADAAALDAAADAAHAADAEAPDLGEVRPPDLCDELGLARRPFAAGPYGRGFGELAGDLAFTDLEGARFALAERWTGCESFVFVVYYPTLTGNALFSTEPLSLVRSARNVNYVFASSEVDLEARRTRLTELRTRINVAIAGVARTPEEEDQQYRRFHYALDRAQELEGSAGALLADYEAFARGSVVDLGDGRRARAPNLDVFAIDRFQRWDSGGNMNEYVGGPVTLDMASYLGPFFEYQSRLAARLAEEQDTFVASVLELRTTERVLLRPVALPLDLQAQDGLELDLEVRCLERNPFACSEWDRIGRVDVCADAACAERRELARWITPYWRIGVQRWTIDASPLLPLFTSTTAFVRVETGPEWERPTPYELRLDLRFRARGGAAPAGLWPAFGGGTFDASYNMREPFRFTLPAEARGLELVLLLSGHGQTSGENCAEWCDHRHLFELNGRPVPEIRPAPGVGSAKGCAARAGDGVPPGQWGNWAPERAYWCPGLPVAPIRVDLTAQALPGAENVLRYSASHRGDAPPGGDIALSAYLVWYR